MAKSWFAAIEALENSRLNHGSRRGQLEPEVFIMAEVPNSYENPLSSVQEKSPEEEQQQQRPLCNLKVQNIIDRCVDEYFKIPSASKDASSLNRAAEADNLVLQQEEIGVAPVQHPLEGEVGCYYVFPATKANCGDPGLYPTSQPEESWFRGSKARAKVAAWKAQKLEEQSESFNTLKTGLKRKLSNDDCGGDTSARASKRSCINHHEESSSGTAAMLRNFEFSNDQEDESDSEAQVSDSEGDLGNSEEPDSGDEDQEMSSGAEENELDSEQCDYQQVPSGAGSSHSAEVEANFFEVSPGVEETSFDDAANFSGALAESPPRSEAKENSGDHETKQSKYQCKYCDETFKKKKKLKKHLRRLHNFQPDPESATSPIQVSMKRQKKRYWCTCCNRKFKDKRAVVDHQNTLKGIRAYPCNDCNLSFFNIGSLKSHRKLHRSNEKSRHYCSTCNKYYSSEASLRNHNRTFHGGSRFQTFQCNYCVKTFLVRGSLERHVRTHTQEPYTCALCNGTFASRYMYSKHRNLAHNGEKGAYNCDSCNAKFDQLNRLAMHKKSHLGDRISG